MDPKAAHARPPRIRTVEGQEAAGQASTSGSGRSGSEIESTATLLSAQVQQ